MTSREDLIAATSQCPSLQRRYRSEADATMKPRLLDLFCKAGGASAGYAAAGFDVTGVDIEPQPRYPFTFIKADAMTFPLNGFDAIAASPPCHDHSALATLQPGGHGTGWMLTATIERLRAQGTPWIVENVEGARRSMPGALTLCGTEFGLQAEGRHLKRHRLFLASFVLMGAGGCSCYGRKIGGVYGNGGGQQNTRGYKFRKEHSQVAMGIDWMTVKELSNAIPPAYTQFLGEQMMSHLGQFEAAP